ncbi:MAG: UDP-N-acetylmuramoyl-L-alanine--D-glutamate ligase [Peptostreptococcus sp.]|uniref:UDP-N-acetylmuramoyl-L-alanine--D-glutamate ligase n=1 Tax=Peptostreptococcus sp. TaxID=1262 RepID=UPI002FCA2EB5
MFSKNKILVVGMARSGIASAKYLLRNGAEVIINDSKNEESLKDVIKEFDEFENVKFLFGRNPNSEDISDIDFAVVSPGVPLDLDYILEMKKNGKEVFSEIELAYRASREKNLNFIGITGTNGKTTTTSIVGEISKKAGYDTYIVGNIGNPAIHAVEEANNGAVLVTELSSFQLESIVDFRPVVSSVLNLTEDHMDRHHTMENYAKAKMMVFKNQVDNDICVLNYDDEATRKMAESCKAKVVYFSRKTQLEEGIFLDEDKNIVMKLNNKVQKIMNSKELSLPGGHNLENCMAATAICYEYGINIEVIVEVLKTFKAVEHRLEYVDTVKGASYINDSKGTNPDSTIKAVQSYDHPIILIAGGYDKGSDFNELFEVAKKHVRSIVILGQTADLIEETAKKHGINDIYRVETIKEAVYKSYEIANENDVVLLSPACASWGMYNNYEERGIDFKTSVQELKEKQS